MRGCVLVFWALTAAAHADELPLVDPAVHEIPACSSVPVFRTDTEAWVTCGDGKMWNRSENVFISTDGGAHWSPEVELDRIFPAASSSRISLRWISSEVGIAWYDHSSWIARSSDGGKSWQRVVLPGSIQVPAIAAAGNRIWLTVFKERSSGGAIIRSDDAGATWRRLPDNPGCRYGPCRELAFFDRDRGSLFADRATWQTSDGGETWSGPLHPQRAARATIWITSSMGWEAGGGGGMLTVDGGQTWREVAAARPVDRCGPVRRLRVHGSPPSRVIFVASESTDLTEALAHQVGTNWENVRLAAFGSDGVVELGVATACTGGPRRSWGWPLRYFVDGKLIRSQPMLSAPSGERERLLGVGLLDDRLRWGWSATRLYLSDDGGASWYARSGPFPEAPRHVGFVEPDRFLLEANSGATFALRTEGADFSLSWRPSDGGALDRSAIRASLGRGESPFACLSTAKSGELDLVYRQFLRHHRSSELKEQGRLRLTLRGDRAELLVGGEWPSPRALSRAARDRILGELTAADGPTPSPEPAPISGFEYDSDEIDLTWICDGKRQDASLKERNGDGRARALFDAVQQIIQRPR